MTEYTYIFSSTMTLQANIFLEIWGCFAIQNILFLTRKKTIDITIHV